MNALVAVVVLQLIQTIPLPGVEGRIDHMAVDAGRQRLFVAALGNNTVEVLDLKAGKRLQPLTGLREPQGIACTGNRLYVASAGDGTCNVFDAKSLRRVQTIELGNDADNVRYDSINNRIYVGYGSGAIAVLDAATGKRLANIPISGHPESFQLETAGRRIYVNVPTAHHIAVIERDAVVATWPVEEAHANFPMALDEAGHRLFIVCRQPAMLLTFDTRTGRVVEKREVSGDCDDVFIAAQQHRLYASCGAGFLDVLPLDGAGRTSIPTAGGARTSFWFADRLYLAVPHRGAQPAEIRVYAPAPDAGW
jgi:DNA-binding beta-propeller fold protein YncE